jgi:protein-disulfide isomerase
VSKRVGQKQAARFMREQAARERARKRRIVVSVAAAAVLLVAGLIGWGVYASQRPDTYTAPAAASQQPQSDGLTIGGGPVTVDVYLDFMCPVCKQFEDQSGTTLDKLVAANKIKLVYHPVAFLDRASTTEYSTRSSASAACAADAGKLAPYVAELYKQQRPEGSAGLSDDELVSAAKTAGITDPAFATCVKNGKYRDWTAHVTDQAVGKGVNATPTVLVNGKQLAQPTTQALQAAVDAAAPKG